MLSYLTGERWRAIAPCGEPRTRDKVQPRIEALIGSSGRIEQPLRSDNRGGVRTYGDRTGTARRRRNEGFDGEGAFGSHRRAFVVTMAHPAVAKLA
jgi:hypothetical protein